MRDIVLKKDWHNGGGGGQLFKKGTQICVSDADAESLIEQGIAQLPSIDAALELPPTEVARLKSKTEAAHLKN